MKLSIGDSGCVCILLNHQSGAPVQAFGNVPPALVGAKWADVRTWACLLWKDGRAHVAQIKSDFGPQAPDLPSLISHLEQHPTMWTRVEFTMEVAQP